MEQPKFSLVRDVLSGIIMAGTSIPQLIAYAESVGYAPTRGLSTAGPSLLAWGLSTNSPWISCGVTSVTALLAKSDLDGEKYVMKYGEEAYVKLVSAYSVYIGIASVILAVTGLVNLVKYIPKPVRSGFKWGTAVGVLCSAIPNGFLLKGNSTMKEIIESSEVMRNYLTYLRETFSFAKGAVSVTKVIFLLTNPIYWTLSPTVMVLLCCILLTYGKKMLPKSFPPGIDVILVTLGANTFNVFLDYYEGAVIGEIPSVKSSSSLLPFEVLDFKTLWETPIAEHCFSGSYLYLFLSATIFASINFLSIVGVAYAFETENDIPWTATREIFAQGVACFAAGFTASAPVGGSLSRSLISRMTGATSSLASIVTALCWIWLLPYMSFMSTTPKSALSAVIITAVIKSVFNPKDLIRLKNSESFLGWSTGVAVALTTPTTGFGFGMFLFLLLRSTGLYKTEQNSS